jgi:hypothetical protein
MAFDTVSASELYDIHQEHARERSKLELRIERLEHDALVRTKRSSSEYAKRGDLDLLTDQFDELVSICKRQQKMIEWLYFASDLDPNGEDFDE